MSSSPTVEHLTTCFNDEMLLPYRRGSRGALDIGMPIKLEQLRNTSDDEPVWVEYSDGSRHKLSITAGEVKEKSRTSRVWGDATLYQREVQRSGHVLSIKQRCAFKILLMSLCETVVANIDC